MMKLIVKIKHYWHDFYYAVVPQYGVGFALRCQEVAEEVDLHQSRKSVIGFFRFYLHISLCQACGNYNKSSLILRKALREMLRSNDTRNQVARLNQELINKFAAGGNKLD